MISFLLSRLGWARQGRGISSVCEGSRPLATCWKARLGGARRGEARNYKKKARLTMQPITEQTARELTVAIRELTIAIQSSAVPQISVGDSAYVARSIVAGIDGIKAENKRNRATTKRTKR